MWHREDLSSRIYGGQHFQEYPCREDSAKASSIYAHYKQDPYLTLYSPIGECTMSVVHYTMIEYNSSKLYCTLV